MKIKNSLGAFVWAILVIGPLVFGPVSPIGMGSTENALNSEQVDFKYSKNFDLDNTTSVEFEHVFALAKKQEVSLLHIKCQSTKNIVEDVVVTANLNGITTSETFEDSNNDYSSPHTYFVGTTLTLKIAPSTPIYYLSNTIKVNVTVNTATVFNEEKGDFNLLEVIFETFTSPTITDSSENVKLPLRISQGAWYISPLTFLKERRLESEIYIDVPADVRTRLDFSYSPSNIPLSKANFIIMPSQYDPEDKVYSARSTTTIDLIEQDTLTVIFVFRPSTELKTDVIELTIEVTITGIPVVQNSNDPESFSDFALDGVAFTFLEGVRLLMIFIPVGVFYIRKQPKQVVRKDNIAQTMQ